MHSDRSHCAPTRRLSLLKSILPQRTRRRGIQVSATARLEHLENRLLLTGTGLFEQHQVFSDSNGTSQQPVLNGRDIALGDLDGDGDLDALAVGHSIVQSFQNNGTGTFSTYSGGVGDSLFHQDTRLVGGRTVALGDIDNDGDLDAIIGRDEDGTFPVPDVVLLGNGDGTFDVGQTLTLAVGYGTERAFDVDLADLNGDGFLDLYVANANVDVWGRDGYDHVWINMADGTGTFKFQTIGSYQDSASAAIGDLDGDGDLDAWVVGRSWSGMDRILTNDGDGNFSEQSVLASNLNLPGLTRYRQHDVELADLNADGLLDAVVSNDGDADGARTGVGVVQVYINQGGLAFTRTDEFLVNPPPYDAEGHRYLSTVQVGQLDSDDLPDLFVTGYALNELPGDSRAFVNIGSNTPGFTSTGQVLTRIPDDQRTGFANGTSDLGNRASALGDLNGDGALDVIVVGEGSGNSVAGGIRVYLNEPCPPSDDDLIDPFVDDAFPKDKGKFDDAAGCDIFASTWDPLATADAIEFDSKAVKADAFDRWPVDEWDVAIDWEWEATALSEVASGKQDDFGPAAFEMDETAWQSDFAAGEVDAAFAAFDKMSA